jgi:catechol 2,3-dioxygenase-like lactoylglutathione lyase family enzyme
MEDAIMKNSAPAKAGATANALPLRLHHNAYVCADQERTRHFYEDILGLPLVATWIEEGEFPEFPGRRLSYSHTFYGIGDGGALAFFAFADPEVATAYAAKKQPLFIHIALAVTEATQKAIGKRVADAGLSLRETDHGYCKSIYVQDPDGLLVEFTSDPPHAGEIAARQRGTAHETLRRWQAGDRQVNNTIRPHR